jgi:hypothetical protein
MGPGVSIPTRENHNKIMGKIMGKYTINEYTIKLSY